MLGGEGKGRFFSVVGGGRQGQKKREVFFILKKGKKGFEDLRVFKGHSMRKERKGGMISLIRFRTGMYPRLEKTVLADEEEEGKGGKLKKGNLP